MLIPLKRDQNDRLRIMPALIVNPLSTKGTPQNWKKQVEPNNRLFVEAAFS